MCIRDSQDTLYTRQRKVFAPKGISYEKTSQTTLSPTCLLYTSTRSWSAWLMACMCPPSLWTHRRPLSLRSVSYTHLILEALKKHRKDLRVRVYKTVEDEEAWNNGEVDVPVSYTHLGAPHPPVGRLQARQGHFAGNHHHGEC